MHNIFFTSDTHFYHKNILKYSPIRLHVIGRTLEDYEADRKAITHQYSDFLIEKWNEQVTDDDDVYFLGDLAFIGKEKVDALLNKLNGKIHLIKGNHDDVLRHFTDRFVEVKDIESLTFTNNQFKFISPEEPFKLILCHYPLLTWEGRTNGTCMVHGHCHGSIDEYNTESNQLRVDIGLDGQLAQGKLIDLLTLYQFFENKVKGSGFSSFFDYAQNVVKTSQIGKA